VTDAEEFEQRRRGRRPKPDKRVPLSLLIDPCLHSLLVNTAEKEGRSVTRQTEFVLKQGVEVMKCTPVISWVTRNDADPHQADVLGKKFLDGFNEAMRRASHIGPRAAAFLEMNYPGRGKDERIARDLGISDGMAKLLRQGRAWTVARLDQAMELWPGFRGFVFPAPRFDQTVSQLEQLAAGLARLANEIAELRQELRNAGRSAPPHR
jgi:hypothetical protein